MTQPMTKEEALKAIQPQLEAMAIKYKEALAIAKATIKFNEQFLADNKAFVMSLLTAAVRAGAIHPTDAIQFETFGKLPPYIADRLNEMIAVSLDFALDHGLKAYFENSRRTKKAWDDVMTFAKENNISPDHVFAVLANQVVENIGKKREPVSSSEGVNLKNSLELGYVDDKWDT